MLRKGAAIFICFFAGRHKCREDWPSKSSERAYNIFLDAMLLLVPLIIMTLAYSLIVSKLWKGLRREIRHNSSCRRQCEYIFLFCMYIFNAMLEISRFKSLVFLLRIYAVFLKAKERYISPSI